MLLHFVQVPSILLLLYHLSIAASSRAIMDSAQQSQATEGMNPMDYAILLLILQVIQGELVELEVNLLVLLNKLDTSEK